MIIVLSFKLAVSASISASSLIKYQGNYIERAIHHQKYQNVDFKFFSTIFARTFYLSMAFAFNMSRFHKSRQLLQLLPRTQNDANRLRRFPKIDQSVIRRLIVVNSHVTWKRIKKRKASNACLQTRNRLREKDYYSRYFNVL